MAKWGEGDPRWIVEERADATNVNNWHWSEKNATPWSKTRLRELLENTEFSEGPIVVKFSNLRKIEGEATANNRKAKLIFLFEWVLELNFVANVSGSEIEYKGFIEIPNLSDENDADEIDVNVTIDTKGPADAQLRYLLSKAGTQHIREILAVYIKELKEEFSKGLILPTDKVKAQVVVKGKTTATVDKKSFQNQVTVIKSEKKESTGPVATERVAKTETYRQPPERVFECLTQEQLVRAWSAPSKWDFKPDGQFVCFNGAVTGTFLTIEENKSFECKWRLKSFPNDHHAIVKFTIKDLGDCSELEIDAANVPTSNLEETKSGFERYYLENIGRTFGFSSRIF